MIFNFINYTLKFVKTAFKIRRNRVKNAFLSNSTSMCIKATDETYPPPQKKRTQIETSTFLSKEIAPLEAAHIEKRRPTTRHFDATAFNSPT